MPHTARTPSPRASAAAGALLGAGLLLGLAAPADAQRRLNLDDPEQALKAEQKIHCSLTHGQPVLYWWQGNAYSRVPGERDRLLYALQGMNVRACAVVNDPERGYGYRLVSREIMLYLDPQSGEVLRTWTNPWSGQEVEVLHVANDPVNFGPTFAQGARGPFRFAGIRNAGWVARSIEVPLFYTNPLAGEFQEQVGGKYQAVEMFNFFMREDDLLDARRDGVRDISISWSRVAPWLPWMQMGDRPGQMYFHAAGRRLASWNEMPEVLRREIAANFPEYREPPPLDDARPNETSWTYYRRLMEERRAQQATGARQ